MVGHGKLKNPGNKRKTSLSDLYNGCFFFCSINRKYEKPPSHTFNMLNFEARGKKCLEFVLMAQNVLCKSDFS